MQSGPASSLTAPQVSSQVFVPPVINPVKPAPKISALVNDQLPSAVEVAPTQAAPQTESSEPRQEAKNTVETDIDSEEVVDDGDNAVVDENFETAWNTMFDLLFVKIATVYYPMKGVIPKLKDNVIYVKVKNELMKENFEPQIRLALEYLRNNYSPKIDNIVVRVEEVKEEKSTLIYDTQDKMNDLWRENPQMPEFLKILNLSAKDM